MRWFLRSQAKEAEAIARVEQAARKDLGHITDVDTDSIHPRFTGMYKGQYYANGFCQGSLADMGIVSEDGEAWSCNGEI